MLKTVGVVQWHAHVPCSNVNCIAGVSVVVATAGVDDQSIMVNEKVQESFLPPLPLQRWGVVAKGSQEHPFPASITTYPLPLDLSDDEWMMKQ